MLGRLSFARSIQDDKAAALKVESVYGPSKRGHRLSSAWQSTAPTTLHLIDCVIPERKGPKYFLLIQSLPIKQKSQHSQIAQRAKFRIASDSIELLATSI